MAMLGVSKEYEGSLSSCRPNGNTGTYNSNFVSAAIEV